MKLTDFNKIKKLMQLSQSDNDNEALSALRKANGILKANNVDWDRVFSRTVTVVNEVESAPEDYSPPAHPRKNEIDDAFALVRARASNAFIESLYSQWIEKGWLSPKQEASLFKNLRAL